MLLGGDDIVIADSLVAAEYIRASNWLEYGYSKENPLLLVVANSRFIVNKNFYRMDLSPLSVKLIRACSGFVTPEVLKVLGFQGSLRRCQLQALASESQLLISLICFLVKRHIIMMHTPIRALPFQFWFAFPGFL